jgi:probable HAF family extracellular repeat protein
MLSKTFYRIILAAALYLASLSAHADYTFTYLETPSGSWNSAKSINNLGQIVGLTTSSVSIPWHAMLWDNGVAIQLDTSESLTYDINNSGQIVGVGSNRRATLWDNGSVIDLGRPGMGFSQALGINDSGQVVGSATYDGISLSRATTWNNGVATKLVSLDSTNTGGASAIAINSSGQIVGLSATEGGGNAHATLWSNGGITDLGTIGNGYTSVAHSINNSGQIVGYSSTQADGWARATLWSNGGITDLGTIGSDVNNWSYANSINNSGQIVGFTAFSDDGYNFAYGAAATLWSDGNIVDLNTFLSASDVAAGWKLISANDINDNGSIIGEARNNQLGIRTVFLMSVTPVPEADTSAMLLIGLGVIAFMVRRRKQSAA